MSHIQGLLELCAAERYKFKEVLDCRDVIKAIFSQGLVHDVATVGKCRIKSKRRTPPAGWWLGLGASNKGTGNLTRVATSKPGLFADRDLRHSLGKNRPVFQPSRKAFMFYPATFLFKFNFTFKLPTLALTYLF